VVGDVGKGEQGPGEEGGPLSWAVSFHLQVVAPRQGGTDPGHTRVVSMSLYPVPLCCQGQERGRCSRRGSLCGKPQASSPVATGYET
jgi:hypothetical protein